MLCPTQAEAQLPLPTCTQTNLVGGNADVGIYVGADAVSVSSNRVYDFGPDVAGVNPDMDIGIANIGNVNGGLDNTFTKNRVRCYQQAYDNVTGASNTIQACTDPTSTTMLPLGCRFRPARPSEPWKRLGDVTSRSTLVE